jgi:hypothetical protein
VKFRSNSSKVRSRSSWRSAAPSLLGLSTSVPRFRAAYPLACVVVDSISAVCTIRRDAGVNPTFRRLVPTCGSPEAEAALLLASVNDGRHGGRGADSALLTASPLEVPWAETALWALSGLTDGRQGIRSGLLERSGLGVALEGRWAEAAAPEPSAKRAVMFVIAAACSRAVSGGRWAETAAPELLTLLLAVVPGSRWADAAAPEISTLLLPVVPGSRWAEAAAPEPSAKRAVMFVIAAACSRAVSGGRWAETAAPELLKLLLAVVPGSRRADAAAPEISTLLLPVVPGSRWAEAAAPEISTLLFAFVLGVAVSKGGGLATPGGRDVGGNIFGGRTAGHSTGFGRAVAGSVARTIGAGGAAAAAAWSPSPSPSSMNNEPRARSESPHVSVSGSSREWAVPILSFPFTFRFALCLGRNWCCR